MLILSRKVGERIIIGEGIEVVVQRVSGDRVTLGFAAPRDVKILRGELNAFPASPYTEPVAVAANHHTEYLNSATGSFKPHNRLPR